MTSLSPIHHTFSDDETESYGLISTYWPTFHTLTGFYACAVRSVKDHPAPGSDFSAILEAALTDCLIQQRFTHVHSFVYIPVGWGGIEQSRMSVRGARVLVPVLKSHQAFAQAGAA